jgi:anti-anti-sigma factor
MLASKAGWNDAPEFHVVVDAESNPPVVMVWGEVDLASVAAFREALVEALAREPSMLVLDLCHVTFMGSTGIRELIRAHRRVPHIELRVSTPIVKRALECAMLPDAFAIVE